MRPINLIILIGLSAAVVRADSIIVAFDPVVLTGYEGSTVVEVVQGTIQNIGNASIDETVFTISVNEADSGLVADTDVFAAPTVDAGTTSIPFEMFTLDFSNALVGSYELAVSIFDGAENVNLQYEVDVEPEQTPEPGSLAMMGIALGLATAYQRRRSQTYSPGPGS